MRVLAVCAAALALCASTAAAGLPRHGVFVPGQSLAGIALGQTEQEVRRTLGTSYGVCRGCFTQTWYFTYGKFQRQGLAIEFAKHLVWAVYTLWQPPGWTGPNGLRLGAPESKVGRLAGRTFSLTCVDGYDARVWDDRSARSVYYIVKGKVWGFGLMGFRGNPCRA
jgi:hypothetical protein